jgi:hypothetical protein
MLGARTRAIGDAIPLFQRAGDGMIRLREIGWAVLAVVLTTGLLWVGADAAERRAERAARQADREAVVRLLGTADLFLSLSSRWIRHLSLGEPGAAFQDLPAGLDFDPAGGVIGPAPDLWAGAARSRLKIVRRDP